MPTLSAIRNQERQSQVAGSVAIGAGVGAFLAQRDLRPRSRTVYGQTLARLVAEIGADLPLARLEPAELQAFFDRWYGDAAAATWNLNLAAVRSFLAFTRRQGWLEWDPTAGIERRQVRNNPDLRVIPRGDLEGLWRREDIRLRQKTLWRLLFDTAARCEEILGLDVDDLDLDAKSAIVV